LTKGHASNDNVNFGAKPETAAVEEGLKREKSLEIQQLN